LCKQLFPYWLVLLFTPPEGVIFAVSQWYPAFELDRKLMYRKAPVADRHRPFLHDILQCHEKQFNQCFIAGKAVPRFVTLRNELFRD